MILIRNICALGVIVALSGCIVDPSQSGVEALRVGPHALTVTVEGPRPETLCTRLTINARLMKETPNDGSGVTAFSHTFLAVDGTERCYHFDHSFRVPAFRSGFWDIEIVTEPNVPAKQAGVPYARNIGVVQRFTDPEANDADLVGRPMRHVYRSVRLIGVRDRDGTSERRIAVQFDRRPALQSSVRVAGATYGVWYPVLIPPSP